MMSSDFFWQIMCKQSTAIVLRSLRGYETLYKLKAFQVRRLQPHLDCMPPPRARLAPFIRSIITVEVDCTCTGPCRGSSGSRVCVTYDARTVVYTCRARRWEDMIDQAVTRRGLMREIKFKKLQVAY